MYMLVKLNQQVSLRQLMELEELGFHLVHLLKSEIGHRLLYTRKQFLANKIQSLM